LALAISKAAIIDEVAFGWVVLKCRAVEGNDGSDLRVHDGAKQF
jgi:hypothetical protein